MGRLRSWLLSQTLFEGDYFMIIKWAPSPPLVVAVPSFHRAILDLPVSMGLDINRCLDQQIGK